MFRCRLLPALIFEISSLKSNIVMIALIHLAFKDYFSDLFIYLNKTSPILVYILF
ncbi:MAG: hypothetical protein ACTSWN_11145 [Promethearchaeota archaeon]